MVLKIQNVHGRKVAEQPGSAAPGH
jgi:hypothetical protein